MIDPTTKIERHGKDAAGNLCSEGFYAMSPSNELVVLPPAAGLKDGWRLARDIEALDKDGNPRVARAAMWGEYEPHPDDPPRDPETGKRL